MSKTVDQLVREIRALTHEARLELVDRVLAETHGEPDPALARAWSATVHRRIDEIRNGDVAGVPAATTAEKIRRIVGR